MSDLCEHCARSVDDCVIAQDAALTDLAVLLVLKESVGYAESVDRIIHQWRQHALPLCSPLAID
jgi:hypothetical protein